MKHKNVLEIINLYLSASIFIGEQFSYLKSQGYNMHLICSPDDSLDSFAKKQGISYKAITLERLPSFCKDIKAFIGICKYIRKNKIDTVIVHQDKAVLLGLLAARLMGVKNRIMFSHGVLYDTMHGIKKSIFILEDRFISKFATKDVCVSNSVAQSRLDYKVVKPSKQVILNKGTCGGIDTINLFNPALYKSEELALLRNRLGISETDFILGFCGRLVRDKGVIELLSAFDKLNKSYSGKTIKLLIIGFKEVRDTIPQSAIDIIENNQDIIFTGAVSHDDIAKYYLLMDLFVLPSYREGFPTVILETAAMGVPSIVSRSTGCIDSIIENVTGIYTDITPDDIKNNIEKMLNDEVRLPMKKKCRDFTVNNFDHQVVWPHIVKTIEK